MNYENLLVTKRNGNTEKIDLDKIHRVATWAAEGLENVSVSMVEMRSNIQFYDRINTSDIHETLVKATADLISPETPDYQYMAGRLAIFATRKQAYGEYTPPTLLDHITKLTELGKYDESILASYNEKEINELDEYIDHNRDLDLAYAATQQMIGKYLLQDRVTKQLYESPQMLFMLIAMTGFISYPKETRLQYVKRMYDALSKFEISLPTPIMGGLRTPTRQYSSCFKGTQDVLTDKGYKQIKDIKVGDYVMSIDGQYNEVYATSSKEYTGTMFVRLKAFSGFTNDFMSTEEHMVWGMRKESSVPEWIRADELKIGDYVSIPYTTEVKSFREINIIDYVTSPKYVVAEDGMVRMKTTDPRLSSGYYNDKICPVTNKIRLTNDFFVILGMYIGNGYVSKEQNNVCWTMNIRHVNEIELIRKTITDVFGINPIITPNLGDNSVKITVYSRPIRDLFLNLVGTDFDKKRLSQEIMTMDYESQKYLMKGIFLTDGCITKHGVTLTFSNKLLIRQVSEILIRLKIAPVLLVKHFSNFKSETFTRRNGKITRIGSRQSNYIVTLTHAKFKEFNMFLFENTERLARALPFVTSEKMVRKGHRWFGNEYFSKVSRVEYITPDEDDSIVYDISVRNNPSFVAGNIGVHNCVTIEAGDSLDSINATANAIVNYISQRAGIGVNAGAIRALNSPIRNGEAVHTGVIPFYKHFQTAVKSCSQGK